MNNRIKYLDVAKFIGIFCIYLGHFENSAGNAYPFVFAFHVPLFFFVSGMVENLSADISFGKYLVKNIKNLLIPFYLFALMSLLVSTIAYDAHTAIILNLIKILQGCIRGQYFASSLWFLTCLFVVKNVFFVFRKVCKFTWLNLLLCAALHCVSGVLLDPERMAAHYMAYYNINSACYDIIFYALGYYCFGPLQNLLDWQKSGRKGICFCMQDCCSSK